MLQASMLPSFSLLGLQRNFISFAKRIFGLKVSLCQWGGGPQLHHHQGPQVVSITGSFKSETATDDSRSSH